MSIVIKFISCLFSFSSIIFSFLFALRYKKVRFVNLGLVQLFFFSISLEALYSSVYGLITNHLFLFLFGLFCAVCFAYGIINFSLDLVNVNVKAFIKDFAITPREQETLKELLNGKSNKELAEIFFVTQKTIEAHLGNIYRKVGVKNRFELFSRLQND